MNKTSAKAQDLTPSQEANVGKMKRKKMASKMTKAEKHGLYKTDSGEYFNPYKDRAINFRTGKITH